MLTEQQIQQICEEIRQDTRVQGVLRTGSYVYGTPHQDSDLDLHIVTNDGTNWRDRQSRPFGTQDHTSATGYLVKSTATKRSSPEKNT
ncbi:MAG TPA: nucleotidyltransferase domain-containing protein [Ktedonobacteraceae bacterium]|nr:nucleotidyltransferase domain-containing protein [Ktedonobacteraceae bacterium]